MASEMHIRELPIENRSDQAIEVYLEPWGVCVTLAPHAGFRIVGTGSDPGEFEVVWEADAATVYAWPTSTLAVYEGERLVVEIPIAFPRPPNGMTMRAILDMVLG